MATLMSGASQLGTSARLPVRASRTTVKAVATAQPKSGKQLKNVAFLASSAALLSASPAFAQEEPVDSAIDSLIGAIKAAGEVVKAGVSVVESGIEVVKEGYQAAAPVIEKGVEVTSPVLQQAVKVTSDVAAPALKAALPALQGATSEASKAIEATGLSLKTVGEATKVASDATSAATPYVNKAISFLTTTEPVLLGEYALGAAALYFLAPSILGLVAGSFRGYAGEISATEALGALSSDAGYVLVDIRTAKEKEASGVPDVPSSASSKIVEVEYAVTEDRKLRGQLRDPAAIEAQITALQIASLKRVSGSNSVVLLDRYGPQARAVAKELSKKGFGKVYVVSGGFDGNNGWVKSKLQIKPASTFSSSGLFGTVSTRINRKQLPAPRSA